MSYHAKITKERFGWSARFTCRAEGKFDWISFDLPGYAPWRLTKRGIERKCARRIARWEAADVRQAASYFYPLGDAE